MLTLLAALVIVPVAFLLLALAPALFVQAWFTRSSAAAPASAPRALALPQRDAAPLSARFNMLSTYAD